MKTLHFKRSHLSMVAGALLLAACGGGGGGGGVADPVVAGTDIPQSAQTSSDGAFTFVNSVASATSETSDPLVVGDATLATSETDEPAAI